MKIGLQIPIFTWPDGAAGLAARLGDIAKTADDAGFASIWVMDHYFQLDPMLGKAEEPMLEGYGVLTFLAAQTQRARLGTMVTGVHYRHPGFLIKQATDLDVLSRGRAYFGVGAGWYERESKGLGFPFPSLKTRFEWLEETLQIARQMWSGDVSPFNGRHFQLAEPICSPQPLSQPHPPILIGGMGERKTLRMVAQYADACNLFGQAGEEVLAHKIKVLKEHCDALQRPFSEIEITTLNTARLDDGQTAADVIGICRQQARLGVHQAIFNFPNVHEMTPLEIFGREIIPAAAEI